MLGAPHHHGWVRRPPTLSPWRRRYRCRRCRCCCCCGERCRRRRPPRSRCRPPLPPPLAAAAQPAARRQRVQPPWPLVYAIRGSAAWGDGVSATSSGRMMLSMLDRDRCFFVLCRYLCVVCWLLVKDLLSVDDTGFVFERDEGFGGDFNSASGRRAPRTRAGVDVARSTFEVHFQRAQCICLRSCCCCMITVDLYLHLEASTAVYPSPDWSEQKVQITFCFVLAPSAPVLPFQGRPDTEIGIDTHI